MMLDPTTPRKQRISFEVWKLQFREDCEARGKILGFNALGEYTLRLLWEDGTDPTIEAIVAGAARPQSQRLKKT